MKRNDYLALLRGINAGGKNSIQMNELRILFEKLNFMDIKTYIQSGNVIFKGYENEKKELREKIEKSLFNKMQNEILVAILTLSDIGKILNDIPYGFDDKNKKYKHDIIFLIEPLTIKEVMKEIKTTEGDDKIYKGEKVFYVKRVSKKLTGSYISKIANKFQNITIRNLNTTRKLYELMLERDGKIK